MTVRVFTASAQIGAGAAPQNEAFMLAGARLTSTLVLGASTNGAASAIATHEMKRIRMMMLLVVLLETPIEKRAPIG